MSILLYVAVISGVITLGVCLGCAYVLGCLWVMKELMGIYE